MSCNVRKTNDEEDKDAAMKIGKSFYEQVIHGDVQKLADNFSGTTSPEVAMRTFSLLDSVAGKLIQYEITEVRTDVAINDGIKSGWYEVYAKCSYEKQITNEQILIAISDSTYTYDAYNATIELK